MLLRQGVTNPKNCTDNQNAAHTLPNTYQNNSSIVSVHTALINPEAFHSKLLLL